MDNQMIRAYLMDLYKNPKNYGEIKDYDLKLSGDNPVCGDRITLYIKKDKDQIVDISFECEGCIISKASTSILTEKIKGKRINDVNKDFFNDVKEELMIDLSISRIKCAELSFSIIEKNKEKF
jgi:nitrogen fixation NifU-like protein